MSDIDIGELYEYLENDEALSFSFRGDHLGLRAERGEYVLERYLSNEVLTYARFNVIMSEVEGAFRELREIADRK